MALRKDALQLGSFAQFTAEQWNGYFASLEAARQSGGATPAGIRFFYPRLLLCTETRRQFIAEFFGASWTPQPLIVKQHREDSANRYFHQFSSTRLLAAISLGGGIHRAHFLNLYAGGEFDEATVRSRFPFIDYAPSRIAVMLRGGHTAVSFSGVVGLAIFDNCLFINLTNGIIRAKYIQHACVITKAMTPLEYQHYLFEIFCDQRNVFCVRGVNTTDSELYWKMNVAAQFANLYLVPELREPTIGEFFRQHPEFVRVAFGTEQYVYQPHLKWMEGGAPGAISIPDLLIRREDGFWDIFDLKRPLTGRSRIVRGAKNRRRFISPVIEGAAQLADYEEYFHYENNQRYAEERYNIRVQDPRLVLVVGNGENVDMDEVNEARRMLRSIDIMSYDELLMRFVGGVGAFTETSAAGSRGQFRGRLVWAKEKEQG